MRNYFHIDRYLDELVLDVYEQPPDPGHTEMAQEVIDDWFPLLQGVKTVLDVGCGQGFCQEMFEWHGLEYTGVTLGKDYDIAKAAGKRVVKADFSFLDFPAGAFDIIFSRHSLEHSPMPLLTLMEWERVAKTYLCLILPRPSAFSWAGRNHYALMSVSQARFLMDRAGWRPVWENHTENEFRFMASKINRVSDFDDSIDEYEVIDAPSDAVQSV